MRAAGVVNLPCPRAKSVRNDDSAVARLGALLHRDPGRTERGERGAAAASSSAFGRHRAAPAAAAVVASAPAATARVIARATRAADAEGPDRRARPGGSTAALRAATAGAARPRPACDAGRRASRAAGSAAGSGAGAAAARRDDDAIRERGAALAYVGPTAPAG